MPKGRKPGSKNKNSVSAEKIAKIRYANTGRQRTTEVKEKMSVSRRKNRIFDAEDIRGIRDDYDSGMWSILQISQRVTDFLHRTRDSSGKLRLPKEKGISYMVIFNIVKRLSYPDIE